MKSKKKEYVSPGIHVNINNVTVMYDTKQHSTAYLQDSTVQHVQYSKTKYERSSTSIQSKK